MLFSDALRAPLTTVRQWPEQSQLGARRNALIACTAMARRRAEVLEVDELLHPASQRSEISPLAPRAFVPPASVGGGAEQA